MSAAPSFPWAELMSLGLGRLRLAPEAFWSMTPRELNAAACGKMGLPASLSPPARRDLQNLMQRYPDTIICGDHHA
ncbi:MAG TPA: phage tail assembly chaperone [Rhizobiales bacterium]|nr:phage tail assembly chaperone [Hyphomicrobiales bacterium]